MAYQGLQLGAGGRGLAAAAALLIHTAAGEALVTVMDGHVFKPIERRTLTGINLPPPPPQPRTEPNPSSGGVPDKMYKQERALTAEPVPDAMSWIVPERNDPEADDTPQPDTPPPSRMTRSRTGCEDCGWWPENDWQYYEPSEPYPIDLGRLVADSSAPLPGEPATPANDPTNWIAPNELPIHQRHSGNGSVDYSLTVDRNGRVERCAIIRHSSARIDEAVCRLISMRARFEPATSWNGAAVEGAYNGTVRWETSE